MTEEITTTLAAQENTEAAGATTETPETETTLAATETTEIEQGQTEENKGQETKKSEEKTIPEKYEVKLPEGMELDQAMLDAFTPVFKELKLSQEDVQKLAETYQPLITSKLEDSRKQALADYKQIILGWRQETIKRLGVNYQKELSFAAKAIGAGNEEFRALMADIDLGFGNHPAIVEYLIKIGKKYISEDSFPDSTKTAQGSAVDKLYPTMKK